MTKTETVYGRALLNNRGEQLVIGGKTPRGETGTPAGQATDLVVETRQSNKAASAKATILGTAATGDQLKVQLTDNQIFQGTVQKREGGVGSRTRVVAFDALHALKRTTISETFDAVAAGDVLRRIAETADVDIRVTETTTETLTLSLKEQDADSAVEKVTKLAGLVWYINAQNQLLATPPSKVGERRIIENPIDVSAGKRTPPYQRVVVIGNSPTSRRGLESRQLISSQPVAAARGSGEPVYEYEDDDIASQEQAENIATTIFQRLQQQQRGGFIEVLGRSDIRPFDTLQFPPGFGGGAEYLAKSVKHRISQKTAGQLASD
jgi:hypothetical protein